jgi:predicted enzyme related to lactoylglutathione lyase
VVGVHARGPGPGDSFSLPYFAVSDIAKALERVEALGGSVVPHALLASRRFVSW